MKIRSSANSIGTLFALSTLLLQSTPIQAAGANATPEACLHVADLANTKQLTAAVNESKNQSAISVGADERRLNNVIFKDRIDINNDGKL